MVPNTPLFVKTHDFNDSYACRKGKGTHRALDRTQQFLRRYPYYLKTDIIRVLTRRDRFRR